MPDLVKDQDLYVVCGLFCFHVYLTYSDKYCRGISLTNECCCCLHECCYMEREAMTCFDKKPDHIARIGCCCDACTLKYPNVCCQHVSHCLCLICSCALPTTEEVPCIASCCFCTCYPKWAHCHTINQVTNTKK